MNVPKYNEMMLPLLKYLSDGEEHTTQEILNHLAQHFRLSDEDVNLRFPNSNSTYFYNRANWAKTYLKKAKLIESSSRSVVVITDRGKQVLRESLHEITPTYLLKFDEFSAFMKKTSEDSNDEGKVIQVSSSDISPEEAMSINFSRLINGLADDILEKVSECSPAFFENLVVDLLVKMGYGGTLKEAGQVVGKSGDGGIDGVIKEDRLGLDAIYVQAKRWEGSVGGKEIQAFVGAIAGRKAKKGVFITTSYFTKAALDYVNSTDFKIILIDGKQLAELMIEFNVGVSAKKVYEVKQIDMDYFEV